MLINQVLLEQELITTFKGSTVDYRHGIYDVFGSQILCTDSSDP